MRREVNARPALIGFLASTTTIGTMGAISDARSRRAMRLLEKRGLLYNGSTGSAMIPLIEGGGITASGMSVDAESAVSRTVAVYACVSLLSETIATLPLMLYRESGDRDRTRVSPGKGAWEARTARLLHEAPNPEMTAQEFWELAVAHTALWGNFYAEVDRGADGRPAAIWPLRPDHMEVVREDGGKMYRYFIPDTGAMVDIPADRIMHLRGFGTDPLVGLSPIAVARETIGEMRAAGRYAASFFANGSTPGGVLSTNAPMTPERVAALRTEWESKVGGLTNAQRVAILHSGLSYQSIGIPQRDAQFLEQRKFALSEIARLFRIPPHMIGDVDRSTSWGTGIEQQFISFLTITLRPWLERIEQAVNRDLGLVPGDTSLRDEGLIAEFLIDGLLRADIRTRFGAYATGLKWGFLTRNEVRERENLPPLDGLDEPLDPTMTPADATVRSFTDEVAETAADSLPKEAE